MMEQTPTVQVIDPDLPLDQQIQQAAGAVQQADQEVQAWSRIADHRRGVLAHLQQQHQLLAQREAARQQAERIAQEQREASEQSPVDGVQPDGRAHLAVVTGEDGAEEIVAAAAGGE